MAWSQYQGLLRSGEQAPAETHLAGWLIPFHRALCSPTKSFTAVADGRGLRLIKLDWGDAPAFFLPSALIFFLSTGFPGAMTALRGKR
jgi:hypothetical protein